jgi:two-component system nitrogen regulation sensor histidine kinase GlnL
MIETDKYIDRQILDSLSTAVLLFDEGMVLQYINTAGEILFDISARQLIGRNAEELVKFPSSMVKTYLRRIKKAEQPFTEREHQMHLAGGKQITVDCTLTPVSFSGLGKAYLMEIQQVDHQLKISRGEHLLSRNQVSRFLVRNLAHEIKNPLGGLRGAAQLLERELPEEELKEYTQIIIQEADRMQKLVDNMLGPNKPPEFNDMFIHQVLERVCSLVLVEVGPGLTIKKDYDPSIPIMSGDMDQLIQALLNIVRNAARAAGHDGEIGIKTRVQRQMTIGAKRHRHTIVVEISDNGPGIPKDLQDQIFFPMVSGQQDGEAMGVGLSIAQELINRHHGLIEFTSEPGNTVFRVLLPLELNHG